MTLLWNHTRRVALECGLLLLGTAAAAFGENCFSCQNPVGGRFYWMNQSALPKAQPVCLACAALETTCAICRLPVNKDCLQLDDGRRLCKLHARDIVLEPRDAERVFAEAQREAERFLGGLGTISQRSVRVELADPTQLLQLAPVHPPADDTLTTLGLTQSRRTSSGFMHTIRLLRGLYRERLTAVCAHEFTHVWMNENVPLARRLDANTVEGFCELVAFKVMNERGAEVEKKVILANAYTRGEIDKFVKAAETHHFEQIVVWLKSGENERLADDGQNVALAMKPSEPIFGWPRFVPTPVPATLQLKGVSGRPGRWFALINDQTLQPGETARVRVGNTSTLVRCVSITKDSAVIELPGTGERKALELGEP